MSERSDTKLLEGWSEESVGGHPCDVFEPPQRNPHGFVVIYLHGVHLNRLVGNESFTAEFARHGLPAVVPMTQRSWWTNRICAEFDPKLTAERHLLENVLPWIEGRFGSKPPQIALLGTSMGGQGALRFAFKYPNRFPIAAAISPAIDYYKRMDRGDEVLEAMYDEPEAARQDSALLHIHALNWPRNLWFSVDPTDAAWYDSSDKLRMKLGSLGIPFTCDLETRAGGHSFDYYNHQVPKAMAFIADKLERERLRVP